MREIKYQVYIDKDVEYVGGQMWHVCGLTWREFVDDGEPENPIKNIPQDIDICSLKDTEIWTKTSWQGEYVKGKFHLREFTGLKDKKGVEIYEGDVVKDSAGDPNWSGGKIYVIEWNEDEQSFRALKRKLGDWCEVIGNIYQNPEILK